MIDDFLNMINPHSTSDTQHHLRSIVFTDGFPMMKFTINKNLELKITNEGLPGIIYKNHIYNSH